MSLHLAEAWAAVVGSPLFGILLTLAAYAFASWLWERTGHHALGNPVLVSIVLVALVLGVTRVGYDQYWDGARFIAFLLGPATVALALPLYRQADKVREAAPMVVGSVLLGCLTALLTATLVTRLAGGDRSLVLSMAPRSATTPIAIAVSTTLGGIPSLSAVFSIASGVLGAVAAPALLSAVRVRDHRARGLAVGTASHGIGTARVLHDDPTEGAFSGLAMALNGLLTALLAPLLLTFLS